MTATPTTAGKRVRLAGVTKRFGDVTAVAGVDADVAAGEFCTLLGPSGSGKTTLLKIVAGYDIPSAGSVHVDGRDVGRVPVAKRNIGMVFQSYALFPHMTVAGNLAFPLEMRRRPTAEIRDRIARTLALVGLTGYDARHPRQLSGGQQQSVALARALIFDPDILLMDEPLGALDKNLRQAMQVELKRLHRRVGVTVIYVTHDQEEAMHLSDRVIVLNHGRVEQAGSPEELYNRPNSVFVAGFLGECNFLPGRIDRAAGQLALAIGGGVTVPWSRANGDGKVLLGIRPEKLRAGETRRPGLHAIDGILRELTFTGAEFRLQVEVGEQLLLCRQPNRDFRPPELGSPLRLDFDPSELIVLPSGD